MTSASQYARYSTSVGTLVTTRPCFATAPRPTGEVRPEARPDPRAARPRQLSGGQETNRGRRLTRAPSCGDDQRVRFPRQPQAYTRTCAQCGSTWHVPTSARQWRSRLVNRFLAEFVTIAGAALGGDPDTVARRAESISERNRQAKTSRHCPNCGADHFTQRVSRRELPY